MDPDQSSEAKETDAGKASQYRMDKRQAGIFNVVFGVIFLAWAAFDLVFNEFWYSDIFFALLGVAFIIQGVMQISSSKAA